MSMGLSSAKSLDEWIPTAHLSSQCLDLRREVC